MRDHDDRSRGSLLGRLHVAHLPLRVLGNHVLLSDCDALGEEFRTLGRRRGAGKPKGCRTSELGVDAGLPARSVCRKTHGQDARLGHGAALGIATLCGGGDGGGLGLAHCLQLGVECRALESGVLGLGTLRGDDKGTRAVGEGLGVHGALGLGVRGGGLGS